MDRATSNLAARLQLYVITDQTCARGRDLLTVARAALAGGATAIQLREKKANSALLYAQGQALRALTREYGAFLIINDRIDVALAVEADGVHLGQDDFPLHQARPLLGQARILGISAGNRAEAAAAIAAGADYLGIGPIFGTERKADAGPPIGTRLLSELAASHTLPLIAIGGLTTENAELALQAGATGLAVITAVVGADDIQTAAARLGARIQRHKQSKFSSLS